jgi:putative Ca2+/H+ antiporter (TMEM165/GDT1 family)
MSVGEILVTAFVLQLTALPGEKGQLVIASLATRYNPSMVVAGAATAFGGWTALEILLGSALEGALPVVYLDAITAALFVLFAGWLLATTADGEGDAMTRVTDDGGRFAALESAIPPRLRGFLPSFSLMVVGEFGDKTQLVTIGLAVQYGASPAIWLGEMLAIVPVSLATALVFHRTADRLQTAWLHRLAAGIFLLFAVDIVASYTLGISVLPL